MALACPPPSLLSRNLRSVCSTSCWATPPAVSAIGDDRLPEALPGRGPSQSGHILGMRKLRLLRQDDHEKTAYISQGEHTRHPLFEMS